MRPTDQIGDFNNDGRDDVIQLYENGNAYVWLSNGTSFNNYTLWGRGLLPSDRIADVNNDGRDDLVRLSDYGNVYVALSNGSSFGNFSIWGLGPTGAQTGNQFATATAASAQTLSTNSRDGGLFQNSSGSIEEHQILSLDRDGVSDTPRFMANGPISSAGPYEGGDDLNIAKVEWPQNHADPFGLIL